MKNQMPHNPTMKSFKRAMTTSFGSICLGSLLVAILQTLRAIFRSLRNGRNQFLVWYMMMCVNLANVCQVLLIAFWGCWRIYYVTLIFMHFHKLLFMARRIAKQHVTRGISFIATAVRPSSTVQHRVCVSLTLLDNLISNVLSMGALFGAMFSALLGGLIGSSIAPQFWIGCAVLGFIVAFAMLIVVMETIQSSVCTIFVCFAEDSEALRRNDPLLHQKFVSTYNL